MKIEGIEEDISIDRELKSFMKRPEDISQRIKELGLNPLIN